MNESAKIVLEVDSSGVVHATGDLSAFAAAAQDTQGKTDGLMGTFAKMRDIMQGPIAAYKEVKEKVQELGEQVMELIGEYEKGAKAETNLVAVLNATGGAAGITRDELDSLANSMGHTTVFEEDVLKQSEAVLLTFRQIGHDVFPMATKAIADMATVMGMDLQSATVLVGKAPDDPIKGMTALHRVGVDLTDSQKKQIEQFMQMNDLMDAQKVIIGELNKEFGDAAQTFGDSAAGSVEKLKNQFTYLKESMGELIAVSIKPWMDNLVKDLQHGKDSVNAWTYMTTGKGSGQDAMAMLQADLKDAQEKLAKAGPLSMEFGKDYADGDWGNPFGMPTLISTQQNEKARIDLIQQQIATVQRRLNEQGYASTPNVTRTESSSLSAAEQAIGALTGTSDINVYIQQTIDKAMKTAEERETMGGNAQEPIQAAISAMQSVADKLVQEGFLSSGANDKGQTTTVGYLAQGVSMLKSAMDQLAESKGVAVLDKLSGKGTRSGSSGWDSQRDPAIQAWADAKLSGIRQLNAAGGDQALMEHEKNLKELQDVYFNSSMTRDEYNQALIKESDNYTKLKQKADPYLQSLLAIQQAIQDSTKNAYIDSFKALGQALASGADSGTALKESLEKAGLQLLNNLPMMLLNAGLMAMSMGNLPIGIALIAASGIVALGAGVADTAASKQGLSGYASGGVFGGGVTPFAGGGVVSKPTMFAFAGGAGLMGEAGAEAIMPLTRASNGALGVAATGMNVSVAVIDQSKGVEVQTQSSRGPNGEQQLLFVLRDSVKSMIASGELDGAMKRYAVAPAGIRRS